MNKLAFFAAMAAAMGVSYDELSEERKQRVNEVYKDHLNVKHLADSGKLLISLGLEEDRLQVMNDAIADSMEKEDKPHLSNAIEEFTGVVENPVELFASGFMLGRGISMREESQSLPQMLAQMMGGK